MADRPTRSWLFTPATRADRFAKAAEASADVLILDLEDAVAPVDKAAARAIALDYLVQEIAGPHHALRLNGLDTPAGVSDLDALLQAPANPDFLVLPKTESAGHVVILDRLLSASGKSSRIVALVESARGISRLEEIAGASPRLYGLMLGAADLAADLGSAMAREPLADARSRLVAACALAGVAPVDSPFFEVRDPDGLAADVAAAVAFGFVAKAAIHPTQVGPINAALTPTAAEIDRARRILEANQGGVGVVDGQMIDEAVARKARRVLAAAPTA